MALEELLLIISCFDVGGRKALNILKLYLER